MPLRLQFSDVWLPCLILVVFWARPTAAFGAGNIASMSAIEGQKWRHGDIEDTLLTLLISSKTGKKFGKMDVKRVYFGNWLRDYSQAVDVGTVKMVSAEAIRILLWVLGFMSFGYGTKEFEVTRDRLGCYRPEEHIDNPKDYADNLDARNYDRRLRGPVDERRELSVDTRTGLKNYIASEDLGITTSAGMVRDLLRRCIDLGRRSNSHGPNFYEALRLLGTATHCMEDYSAHSNYIELTLIELGAHDVFPHVGSNARFHVQAAGKEVYPIVTGTFGGVDFLHSVCGEISDKATQSEIQELEGTISDADKTENKSQIKELLSKLPSGIFGGKDEAGKADELEQNANAAAMANLKITPKEPEAFTKQIGEIVKQIYPIMEWHDNIFKSIAEFIEKIPILPELIEQIQDQITIFVFSLLAPFVLPILRQVKAELSEGSTEVIASSKEKQHIVFNNHNSTDPTHSMLSKDHFSNVLNEPAGRVASAVLKWAVPQIVQCWDGKADPEHTINRIINAVFHHPACVRAAPNEVFEGRQVMFNTVKQWWDSQPDKAGLARQLSRDGVLNGRNHRPDETDTGHGCGKPLGMARNILGGGQGGSNPQVQLVSDQASKLVSDAVGGDALGGALGGLVGGLLGGIGGSLLGGAFGSDEKKSIQQESFGQDGSYTQSTIETDHHQPSHDDDSERFGQAQYQQTQYPGGGRREEYSRQEQSSQGGSYSYKQKVETSSYSASGGYERREERHIQHGDEFRSEEKREGFDRAGQYYSEYKERRGSVEQRRRSKSRSKSRSRSRSRERQHQHPQQHPQHQQHRRKKSKSKSPSPKRHGGHQSHSGGSHGEQQRYGQEDSGYSHQESSEYGRQGSSGYGSQQGYGGQQTSTYRQQSPGYGHQQSSKYGQESSGYAQQQSSGYGGQQTSSYGRQEPSGYGIQQGSGYGSGGQQSSSYGQREESSGYGRQEQHSYERQEQPDYGRREQPSYGRQEQPSYGRQEQASYRRQEYGSESKEFVRQQPSGYGSESYSSGGYGQREIQEYQGGRSTQSYGEESQEYGRRPNDEDEYREERRKEYGSRNYGSGYGGGSSGYEDDEYNRRY